MSADDPRLRTEGYLEKHRIKEIIEGVIAELLYQKPANPKQFVVEYLEKTKVAGTRPLLTQDDLKIMFGMFDIAHKGAISVEQANAALKTVLGPRSQLPQVCDMLHVERLLSKEEFVQYMSNALVKATPTCTAGISSS